MFGEQLGRESKLRDNSDGFCGSRKGLEIVTLVIGGGVVRSKKSAGGVKSRRGLIVGRVQYVDARKLKRNKKKTME